MPHTDRAGGAGGAAAGGLQGAAVRQLQDARCGCALLDQVCRMQLLYARKWLQNWQLLSCQACKAMPGGTRCCIHNPQLLGSQERPPKKELALWYTALRVMQMHPSHISAVATCWRRQAAVDGEEQPADAAAQVLCAPGAAGAVAGPERGGAAVRLHRRQRQAGAAGPDGAGQFPANSWSRFIPHSCSTPAKLPSLGMRCPCPTSPAPGQQIAIL